MKFTIGDLVEVVFVTPDIDRSWLGRRLIVVGINRCDSSFIHVYHSSRRPYSGDLIDTSPPLQDPKHKCMHWIPECLKKIDPPDWEAENDEEIELKVKS